MKNEQGGDDFALRPCTYALEQAFFADYFKKI